MFFRIFRCAPALVGLMLLCSCNLAALSGTESLLVAPKLNKRQSEVSQALEASLSLRGIVYKYPQSGEHRSPFVFYDLNGDGADEAIVFYALANDEAGNVRAKILSQRQDGAWAPFYDIPSQSAQVDFVQFRPLLKDSPPCMLIGWRAQERRTSILGVYSMRNGSFTTEVDLGYVSCAIGDFDSNGLFEILSVAPDSDRRYLVSLVRDSGGYLGSGGEIFLSEDVLSVRSLVIGRLDFGIRGTGVYVDEALSDGVSPTIATEVFRVDAAGLSLLAGGEPVASEDEPNIARENYEFTFRNGDFYCADYDGDGVVELPYPLDYPAQDIPGIFNPPMVQLLRLSAVGFESYKTAVLSNEEGYMFCYPARWSSETVVPERDGAVGELRFRKYDVGMEIAQEELLRIRVSSIRSDVDLPGEYAGYAELYLSGTTLYSAYLPDLPGEALALTEQEARDMFLPLVS